LIDWSMQSPKAPATSLARTGDKLKSAWSHARPVEGFSATAACGG